MRVHRQGQGYWGLWAFGRHHNPDPGRLDFVERQEDMTSMYYVREHWTGLKYPFDCRHIVAEIRHYVDRPEIEVFDQRYLEAFRQLARDYLIHEGKPLTIKISG